MANATHNDIAGNFTLDGANLTTKHLTGTLGGDLIVKSRQDTYQYDSKQQNISGSADIDFSGKLQNVNINAGKQQLNAQYAQVTNQSGIIANTSSLNVQGQGNFTGGYLITDANQNHTQFKQGILTDPYPDGFSGVFFAHKNWGIPKNYILFTTGEGEGGYFYNVDDNSVWDCGLGEQHLLGTDQLKHWDSFYEFMVWYLTVDEDE